ncbi:MULTISPECIES: hypothetical protein [Micromonospora]|uniref:hypothetical protein n=1 Tax=Micromonospora TaxID=1873 RepID=UPI001B37216E|nr:hypothetical protein [Micromonospora sp. C81]MBQ1040811.1 hypothetical protein [Micromonospora sp. C81]WTI22283.1 hypothetical protein OG886_04045 [Micromonospora zamorensis]
MDISWSASSPTSGTFVATERSGVAGLVERFGELRAQGQGYLEVRGDANFPVCALGFKGSAAVVHLMSDDGVVSPLVADQPADVSAEVLVMDALIEFTADFVLDLDRAWQVVEEFLRTGDPARAGDWFEL